MLSECPHRLVLSRRHEAVFFILFFLVLCVPLWIVKYPAILDYPTHLTRVNIVRHIADASLAYSTYYRCSWHLSYCYFDYVTFALSFIFGVFYAGKISLTIYVLLLLAATRYLLKSIPAPLFPFILWPALFTYNWSFWIGSINLLAGFCFGMFAIGLTWKNKTVFESGLWNSRLLWKLLVLFTLCAACHPISAFLAGVIIIPIILSSRLKGMTRILSIAVFVLAIIALEILGHRYYHQPWEALTNLGRTQWMLHDFYAPPTQARVFKISFLAVLFLWLFLKKDVMRCFFLPALLVLLVLITPHSIDISGDNDMRCGLFAFLLTPFLAPSPSKKNWKIFFSLAFLCFGVYWNIEQVKKQLKYNGTYREIEYIAHQVPKAPRVRQLLTFSGRVDQQAAVYITFYRGGFSPFMFASALHGLAYLKRPDCTYPEDFERLDPRCAEFYNCLIVCKNEGSNASIKGNDLNALGFVRRFEGKHFDYYLK